MRTSFVVSLIGFVASAGVGACYIESPKPSTFRFGCESAADCEEGEVCDDGLCQQACGGPDDAECPDDAPVCLNGHCSNVCPVADDVCPEPQDCVTIEDPEATEPATSGFCAVPCDETDHPCAEGQTCFEGICLTPCVTDDECGMGETCYGVCIPSFG